MLMAGMLSTMTRNPRYVTAGEGEMSPVPGFSRAGILRRPELTRRLRQTVCMLAERLCRLGLRWFGSRLE
jgi:hypothetical protein